MATTEREALTDIADLIVRDCCELDPADTEHPSTLCIRVEDLQMILHVHLAPPAAALAAPPVEQQAAQTPRAACGCTEWEQKHCPGRSSLYAEHPACARIAAAPVAPLTLADAAKTFPEGPFGAPCIAQAAQPAAQAEVAKGVLTQLLNARGRKDVLHAQHMGNAMPDEVYDVFQRLRDETIPSLTLQLHEMLPAPAAAEPGLPQPFGYVSDGFPDGLHFQHQPWPEMQLLVNSTAPVFSFDQLRAYGQAMAEHARGVAMEAHQPSITWVDDMGCTHTMSAEKAASELKALFDAWPDGLNEIEAAIEGWRRAAPPQGEPT